MFHIPPLYNTSLSLYYTRHPVFPFPSIFTAPLPLSTGNHSFFFHFNFFLTPKPFCIGVYPISNIVEVSGEQRRDSAVHIHISILPQTPLPSRLPCNIKQSSMCSTWTPRGKVSTTGLGLGLSELQVLLRTKRL